MLWKIMQTRIGKDLLKTNNAGESIAKSHVISIFQINLPGVDGAIRLKNKNSRLM